MMKEIGFKLAITMGQPALPLRLLGRGAGETRYIEVGASHATRIAEAIQKTHAQTTLAAKPGWRVS
jgi:hypothetical protein